MTGIGEFHLLRPAWLLALVPYALLWWRARGRGLGPRSWEHVLDPALIPYVLTGKAATRSGRWPGRMLMAGVLLAIVALSGPAWQRLPQPVYSSGGALVLALDLSRSMDSADVTPTRLGRARFKIADILSLRREGQTALIAYAGDAFTVTPLTDDAATIRSQLGALSTSLMPVQGSRADRALAMAAELVLQAGLGHADVLLITDEAGDARDLDAAERLRNQGLRVSVLGVGTAHGAPVPLADGGFLKNDAGAIVIPVLDEDQLKQLAAAGGGAYAQLTADDTDLQRLDEVLQGDPRRGEAAATGFRADQWREEGPWLVLLLLPLAALAFRRGYLLLVPLALVLPPSPAQAFEWQDLWLNPDQQAQRALEAGDPDRAAELARDPAWKGAARYRAGDYEGAIEALAKAPGIDSLYNRGNALARAGRYEEAIEAYDEVLRHDSGHADARHNRDVVKKALEQQRQQQQQAGGAGEQNQQQQQPGDQQEGQEQSPQQGKGEGEQEQQQDRDGQPGSQGRPPDAGQDGEADAGAEDLPGQKRPPQQGPEQGREGTPEASEREGQDERRAAVDDEPVDEAEQATEQWLRRIPDDPGGLLRRKFLYQYRQRSEPDPEDDKAW